MIEGLLSDIDGTLVDSNALHADAWRRTFEHFGIEISLGDAWSQIGKGGDQLIPVFVQKDDVARLEQSISAYRKQLFHAEYMSRMVSFPQSRALLLRARRQGIKLGLATSSDKADLATYKRIVGMDDLIEEESSNADAEQSKPEPDIFSAALKKMGMSARQVVALGDTPYDAEAAGKLGIKVIGLTSGGWKRSDLLRAGCSEVYRSPADLLECFDSSLLAK